MATDSYDPTLEDEIAKLLMNFVCHNQKPFSKKLQGFIATGLHDIRAGSAAREIVNRVRAYDKDHTQ